MPDQRSHLISVLFEGAKAMVEGPQGRFRSEDVISATAAFAGEVCMRQAAAFDFDNHTFTPGKTIFSDKINVVLSGDKTDWSEIPVESAFGGLRHLLTGADKIRWPIETFPDVADVYQLFARSAQRVEWGFVPLSVPSLHAPRQPPLRYAFQLRQAALACMRHEPVSIDVLRAFSMVALTKALVVTRSAIAPATAIRIAMETMNGIAKTAPVLPRHI